ncbi:uncharacterized protein LOC121747664 isoform X3 [Salvia splendens]|uniref:uncharacterized protein LOC121747664 isoform X3 n=1 Tax=Salvia splendens TaxID=180675 RepID=UPI001C267014|nr:uncharacterized protein LOC121747664 isoform X3 [Salvia splendens]
MTFHSRHNSLVSYRSLTPWSSVKSTKVYFFSRKITGLDHLIFSHPCIRKKGRVRISDLENGRHSVSYRFSNLQKQSIILSKLRRLDRLQPLASADDGVTVNGSSQSRTNSNMEEIRYKLNQSLQDEDYNTGLVQLLHDAARVFELAIKEQSSLSKISWFSTAWLGVDKNVWVKELAYQASVFSLLLAASEISSRGDGRDRDINVFVQRSLSKQSSPLESVIRDKLLAKQPGAYDWFWSEQIPAAVTSFVNYFEKEQRFSPATAVFRKGMTSDSGSSSDISLLMLALSCIAAIMKLGPTKVSCAPFFSIIPDINGRLMDMMVEFVPVRQAYHSIKEIGLHREFLIHFGPRASACMMQTELGAEEIMFWVGLVQRQLQRAIDREKIWSRLTTSESIEVLERDLAIFGFFIALGRSTQSFLFSNGFETMVDPLQGLIRHLIGGSVLYYPQLSAISSYQLYVEVMCEELDWLPFYPGFSSNSKRTFGHKHIEGPPNAEAIPLVLDVCSYWIESFIKYSKWLENPSNVKAAKFLSKGHEKLKTCMEELGIQRNRSPVDKESQSFDKELENVEVSLLRLEELLQELHVSRSSSGKEHLKAACSDLERIRRLKKEAEFLEVSFRAKAASIQQNDMFSEQETAREERANSESNEIQRFEILRSDLMELEQRVQKSADHFEFEEDEIQAKGDLSSYGNDDKVTKLVQIEKKDGLIEKSLDKLKETSMDVLQGTQLLAIDTTAAMGLLRRVLIGDELTEKEKQALRRTLTDLASVIPIGVLMLIPVTAVGHAAMLAAIQRYVPSLIPSTYGPERLDLLRQLQKVKEMEDEVSVNENSEE